MSDVFLWPVTRYTDPDGNPTCAASFKTGEVCQFYRTQRLGTHETCLFAPESKGVHEKTERRGNKGSLIPQATCPLWKNE